MLREMLDLEVFEFLVLVVVFGLIFYPFLLLWMLLQKIHYTLWPKSYEGHIRELEGKIAPFNWSPVYQLEPPESVLAREKLRKLRGW